MGPASKEEGEGEKERKGKGRKGGEGKGERLRGREVPYFRLTLLATLTTTVAYCIL